MRMETNVEDSCVLRSNGWFSCLWVLCFYLYGRGSSLSVYFFFLISCRRYTLGVCFADMK